MIILLMGAPGSGKGTQAPDLCKRYGILAVSSGDIFRKNLKEGTELGKKAKTYMDKGELVPDSLVIEIVLSRLQEKDVAHGCILDGFPRTIEQAKRLDEFLAAAGKKIDAALCLDVTPEVVIKRLSGRRVCRNCGATYNIDNIPSKKAGICDKCEGELYQRDDDKEATVRNRLEVYKRETAGLLDFYAAQKKLHRVDGGISKETTLLELFEILDKLKK